MLDLLGDSEQAAGLRLLLTRELGLMGDCKQARKPKIVAGCGNVAAEKILKLLEVLSMSEEDDESRFQRMNRFLALLE